MRRRMALVLWLIVVVGVWDAVGADLFAPTSLSFGSVQQGQSRKLSFTIKNSSLNPANYSFVASTASFVASPASITLGAEAKETIQVTFSPGSLSGNISGELAVNLTSGKSSIRQGAITLSGTAVPPPSFDWVILNAVFTGAAPPPPTAPSFKTLQFVVTVKNIGVADAPLCLGDSFVNNSKIGNWNIPRLNAGASADVNVNIVTNKTGELTIKLVVDSQNGGAPETNENNNEFVLHVSN